MRVRDHRLNCLRYSFRELDAIYFGLYSLHSLVAIIGAIIKDAWRCAAAAAVQVIKPVYTLHVRSAKPQGPFL